MSDRNKKSGNDTDDSIESFTDTEQLLGQISLVAAPVDEAPSGATPDYDELWNWIHDRVDDERAAQIRSHIARDPGVYRMWHELRVAEAEFAPAEAHSASPVNVAAQTNAEDLSTSAAMTDRDTSRGTDISRKPSTKEGTGSLIQWLTRLTDTLKLQYVGGAVMAAVLGGVVAINLNKTQPVDIWSDWQTPKAFVTPDQLPDRDELVSVVAGVAHGMNEMSIPTLAPDGSRLPDSVPECVDDDSQCDSRRSALFQLGDVSIRTRVVCLTDYDIPQSINAEVEELNTVLTDDLEASRFAMPLTLWTTAQESSQRCAAANQIIAEALKGVRS